MIGNFEQMQFAALRKIIIQMSVSDIKEFSGLRSVADAGKPFDAEQRRVLEALALKYAKEIPPEIAPPNPP